MTAEEFLQRIPPPWRASAGPVVGEEFFDRFIVKNRPRILGLIGQYLEKKRRQAATKYTVQFRDRSTDGPHLPPHAIDRRQFDNLSEAIDYGNTVGLPFDVSVPSGALAWWWEQREDRPIEPRHESQPSVPSARAAVEAVAETTFLLFRAEDGLRRGRSEGIRASTRPYRFDAHGA